MKLQLYSCLHIFENARSKIKKKNTEALSMVPKEGALCPFSHLHYIIPYNSK